MDWVTLWRHQFRTYSLVAIVILISETCCGQTSREWPFVRGPQLNAYSYDTQMVSVLPTEGPPVLWIRKLGQGYSAFVAADDRVYTQGQNATGLYLYCLEADAQEKRAIRLSVL